LFLNNGTRTVRMLESKLVLVVYLKIFRWPSCMQAGQTSPIMLANKTIDKDLIPLAELGIFMIFTVNSEILAM